VVVGKVTVLTVTVLIGGTYCSYCENGDRGNIVYLL